MKKALKIILIVLLTILFLISALISAIVMFIGAETEDIVNEYNRYQELKAPEEYGSYICYDYHLVALKTDLEENWGHVNFQYWDYRIDDVAQGKCLAYFKDIIDEDESQFLSVRRRDMNFVFQNPYNYVDPWKDWTVEKIEIGYVGDRRSDKHDGTPSVVMGEVIFSTADTNCISNLKTFVLATGEPDGFKAPEGYKREFSLVERKSFCIRVFFEESENIAWVSYVNSYYSEESGDRIIVIDKGKTKYDSYGVRIEETYVNISEYENLYNWLSESIERVS